MYDTCCIKKEMEKARPIQGEMPRSGGYKECNYLLMTKFDNILLSRIYLIKSNIFIGFRNLGTGSRSDISGLGRTYLMYRTYPASGQIPEHWRYLSVVYIRSRSDIFEASDISDHRSGSRTVAAGSDQIYPA
jgi:hypothetical protein